METTRGKEKPLTTLGFGPTISGFDLPLLVSSYEAAREGADRGWVFRLDKNVMGAMNVEPRPTSDRTNRKSES